MVAAVSFEERLHNALFTGVISELRNTPFAGAPGIRDDERVWVKFFRDLHDDPKSALKKISAVSNWLLEFPDTSEVKELKRMVGNARSEVRALIQRTRRGL